MFEPFFTLSLKTQKSGTQFVIKPSLKFPTNEAAQSIKDGLLGVSHYTVKEVNTKEKKEAQPLLYDLTALQKKASSKYGITPDKTLEIAQKLYESKFITYPRTGSQYVSVDVYETAAGLISACLPLDLGLDVSYYRNSNVELSKRSVNDEKVTDHHAILPTDITPDLDTLTKPEKIIYTMIVCRMFEAFHEQCIKDVTDVIIDVPTVGDCKVTGSVIKQFGWRGVQKSDQSSEQSEEQSDTETTLPQMTAGDTLPNDGVDIVADKTKPKPLLTDATLLGYMETAGKEIEDEQAREAIKDCGLGTPATRDSIITGLISQNYVDRVKKNLIPTEKGLATYDIVKDKTIASPELTGQWEKQLMDMSLGKYPYGEFMSNIKTYTADLTGELSAVSGVSVKSQKQTQSEAMPICPKCKAKKTRIFDSVEKKVGGIICTDKDCGFVIWRKKLGKELSDSQLKTLVEKGQTAVINGFVSPNTGNVFAASLKLNLDSQFLTEFVFDKNKQSKSKK